MTMHWSHAEQHTPNRSTPHKTCLPLRLQLFLFHVYRCWCGPYGEPLMLHSDDYWEILLTVSSSDLSLSAFSSAFCSTVLGSLQCKLQGHEKLLEECLEDPQRLGALCRKGGVCAQDSWLSVTSVGVTGLYQFGRQEKKVLWLSNKTT